MPATRAPHAMTLDFIRRRFLKSAAAALSAITVPDIACSASAADLEMTPERR
ncbi:hypothetical protein [Bradyrhizobium sp.]|uniref:hypothetical protein n=1 Tax=Bradyrhizobium sp. TaxID=376 RepID=UPI003C73B7B9